MKYVSSDVANEAALAKYDATGVEAWFKPLDFRVANGVAVDLDNVYAFGWSALSKFDAQGNQLWTHELLGRQQFDGVSFDSNHDVWAYGSTIPDGSNSPRLRFVSMYSAGGTPQWSWSTDGGTWLEVEADARMYFANGGTLFQTHLDAGVDWSVTVRSPDGGTAYFADVIPGAPGQTFVADGFVTADGGREGRVRELGANGNDVWTKSLGGAPRALRFEAAANRLWIVSNKDNDMVVTSLVGGTQQSQLQFGTSAEDSAHALAVSPTQLCVAGQTWGAFAGYVKLDAGSEAFIACIPR